MKKYFIILLFMLFLCGCEKSSNNDDSNIDNNMPDKHTFCYIYSPQASISLSIYYDYNYNVVEDFTLITFIYDSLTEAIENEFKQEINCSNVKENIKCSVSRTDKLVDTGYINSKPDYNYYEKIKELESNGWICKETDND